MKFSFFTSAFLSVVLLGSCAVEVDTPANEDEKMYLEAWIHTHHPNAERQGMGIYVLSETEGDGEKSITMPCYAMVTYTTRDLDGNVTATSDSLVARQTGDYNKSYYYGPRVWNVSENSISKGLEDMVAGMTEGGSKEAVIPGWLQTYNRYGSEEEYMSEVTGNSHVIYTVRLEEVTDDIMQWQTDSIENYISKNYTGSNAPERIFEGFYFSSEAGTDTSGDTSGDGTGDEPSAEDMHKDTTVYINYTGKLLNGQVFDTTSERIAKDNNIYDSSRTYAPVEVTMSSDSTAVKLDGNSVISGFTSTIWRMAPMEKGTGIFYSQLGYGTSGSGSLIPEYAPLIFEIELVENPEE